MKKRISIIVSLLTMSLLLCACESSIDSSTFEGTWQFCGVVEEGSEVSIENAILGDDFLKLYGADDMPENKLIIDESGLGGIYGNIRGSEVGKRNDINKNCFTQEVKIIEVDGEVLDSPIVETNTCTLKDGYLFLAHQYSDSSYNAGNVSVYTKVN